MFSYLRQKQISEQLILHVNFIKLILEINYKYEYNINIFKIIFKESKIFSCPLSNNQCKMLFAI